MPSGGQDRRADAAGVTSSLPPETVYDAEKATLIDTFPAIQLLQALRHPGEKIWLQTFADAPDDAYVREEKVSRSGRPYTLRHWHVSGVPHDDSTTRTVNGIAEQYGAVTPAQLKARPYLVANLARVGVYFAVNSIKADAKRRKSDAVDRVAAVFLDLDGSPLPGAFPIPPTAVVESSLGKYHVYWAVDGVPPGEFSTLQKTLAGLYNGDPVVHDLARVMRLPGYWHGKQDAGFLVQLMELNATRQYTRDDLLTAWPEMSDALRAADADRLERQARAERLKAEAVAALSELGSSTAKDQTAARMKYARIMLEHCRADLLAAPVGQRNSTLNAVAFRVGRHLGAYLDGGEATAVLSEAAEQIGLGESEIRDTLVRALHDGQTKEPFDFAQVGTRAGAAKGKEGRKEPEVHPKPRKPKPQVPRLAPRADRTSPASDTRGYGLPSFPHGTQEGTDEANAVILAANNLQNRLRYTLNQGWYAYDPARGVWMREPILAAAVAGEVLREVVGQYFLDLLKQHADKEDIERVGRWATNVCNVGTVSRALTAAAGKPEFLTPVDAWNARPELLNCPNGTLELTSGTLRPHDPADLMTWQAGAAYDPAAQHPYVERLLELLRADGRHDLLQRWAGSTLYGRAPNEKFVQLYGPGGTGKGTFADTLTAALGEYAYTIDVGLILHNAHGDSGTGPKPELLKLQGKRLVIASEPDEHARFNAGRVKGMTGNDPITARGMHSNDMVTFTPVFKLAIQTNYPIKASHDDSGLQRRMIVVPFSARPATADESFKDTLKTDPAARSAFLNWLVQGCRLWLENGYSLGESAVVQEATAGYWKDQNPYERFAAARLTFGDSRRIISGRLKVMFEDWVAENAIRPREAKLADLYAFLRSAGCEPYRTNLERGWYGVSEASDSGDGSDTDSPVSRNLLHAYKENLGNGVTSVTSVTRDDVTPAVGWDGGEL